MKQSKQTVSKYLIYTAIILLIVNFILLFLPFAEVYQPSYKQTVLGTTTYGGWYTSSAPMVMFIFPIVLTGIPYLCSIISLLIAALSKKKNSKNSFFKIKNNTLNKPIKFFWLKFAAIANVIAMLIVYSMLNEQVGYLQEHGAYCHITFFGILNFVCSIIFFILVRVLSRKTKGMFAFVDKVYIPIADTQQETENETGEA